MQELSMKKYMNTVHVLVLASLTASMCISAQNKDASGNDVKAALQNLGKDFESLGTTIKTNSAKQADAILNEMKDWVKAQENSFKELQASLQAHIDQTKSNIQSKINDIATASETEDEAKAAALLKQLQDETNQSLQTIKDATKAAKEKFEAELKTAKTKWDVILEDLHTKHQKNLKNFTDSMAEIKSYFKGFKDLIKREIAKPFASSTTKQ